MEFLGTWEYLIMLNPEKVRRSRKSVPKPRSFNTLKSSQQTLFLQGRNVIVDQGEGGVITDSGAVYAAVE